jgi:dihydrofolate reductase
MSKISIIVAASDNLAIGKDNKLLWTLPSDMNYFKRITNGNMVVMGKNTWESIPIRFRPLPNRNNVVLTRDLEYEAAGASIVNNLDILLQTLKTGYPEKEIFVIGGGEIYKKAFKYADKLYLTRVHTEIDGDTFLEGFDKNEWALASKSETKTENGLDFTFEVYDRLIFN